MTTALNPIIEYLGNLLELPDLTDPVDIEQFIRHPEQGNEEIKWWVCDSGPRAFHSAVSQLPLAERGRYFENEERTLKLREKERFLVCFWRMTDPNMSRFDMRVMFPNLQSTKIYPGGRWDWSSELDIPLVWNYPDP